jgi:hypothetical protein
VFALAQKKKTGNQPAFYNFTSCQFLEYLSREICLILGQSRAERVGKGVSGHLPEYILK